MSFSQTNDQKINDIKRLLIASGSTSTAKASLEAMAKTMKNNGDKNGLPEGFWDEFIKEVNYDELTALYIPIYDKNYSHQEILDMLNFFEGPTGKKMVEKMPLIIEESMNMGRQYGEKLGVKVYEKMTKKN
ncbi:hypothetical protein GCM10027442_12870 [Emticicia fontis]